MTTISGTPIRAARPTSQPPAQASGQRPGEQGETEQAQAQVEPPASRVAEPGSLGRHRGVLRRWGAGPVSSRGRGSRGGIVRPADRLGTAVTEGQIVLEAERGEYFLSAGSACSPSGLPISRRATAAWRCSSARPSRTPPGERGRGGCGGEGRATHEVVVARRGERLANPRRPPGSPRSGCRRGSAVVEVVEEAHVVVADVDVDEAAQLAGLVEDPALDARSSCASRSSSTSARVAPSAVTSDSPPV